MGNKTDKRRAGELELPRDARADEILEFVFNDEVEALCNEQAVLNHQRDMPGLQEFLQEMHEIDARSGTDRWH